MIQQLQLDGAQKERQIAALKQDKAALEIEFAAKAEMGESQAAAMLRSQLRDAQHTAEEAMAAAAVEKQRAATQVWHSGMSMNTLHLPLPVLSLIADIAFGSCEDKSRGDGV